jgi:hypothetical protein
MQGKRSKTNIVTGLIVAEYPRFYVIDIGHYRTTLNKIDLTINYVSIISNNNPKVKALKR